jgi:6-carboxyhexanoate--CoA ligase
MLASVRMRAVDAGGRHLCGAERLVPEAEAEEVAALLRRRARERGAAPQAIRVAVERVPETAVRRVPALPVTMVLAPEAGDPGGARRAADRLLERAGVAPSAIDAAFRLLGEGPPMRGAALLDARTGLRREADRARGVRVTRLDYAPEAREAVRAALDAAGLAHFRTREALAIASKAAACGVLAEVCWSDEPEYEPGYVAAPLFGYVRFPRFRPSGARGGRALFLPPGADAAEIARRLQREPVLLVGPPAVRAARRLPHDGHSGPPVVD